MVPAEVRPEMSNVPPALVMNRALPPLDVSRKKTPAPLLAVIMAFAALLLPPKDNLPPFIEMVAFAALLAPEKPMPVVEFGRRGSSTIVAAAALLIPAKLRKPSDIVIAALPAVLLSMNDVIRGRPELSV